MAYHLFTSDILCIFATFVRVDTTHSPFISTANLLVYAFLHWSDWVYTPQKKEGAWHDWFILLQSKKLSVSKYYLKYTSLWGSNKYKLHRTSDKLDSKPRGSLGELPAWYLCV